MRRRGATVIAWVLVFTALLGLTFALTPRCRYVELEPGPTFNTLGKSGGKDVITITGAKTTDSTGQLRMLTVYEVEKLTAWDVISRLVQQRRGGDPARRSGPAGPDPAAGRQAERRGRSSSRSPPPITVRAPAQGYPVRC